MFGDSLLRAGMSLTEVKVISSSPGPMANSWRSAGSVKSRFGWMFTVEAPTKLRCTSTAEAKARTEGPFLSATRFRWRSSTKERMRASRALEVRALTRVRRARMSAGALP